MDTNQITEGLSGFVEQVRRAAFHEGRIAGRKEAREELRTFFDRFEENFPLEPVEKRERRSRGPRSTAPAEATVWLSPDQVAPMVKDALATLATNHPEGASPQVIADQLRPNGQPINVQAVRQSLRQLTMQGEVRRVAHARYLPAVPPAVHEPQPEAAE